MSESYTLIKELKRQLKLAGLHYADVAQHLDLSEGSVKRLLAEGQHISLERLERICQLIGLEMAYCLFINLTQSDEYSLPAGSVLDSSFTLKLMFARLLSRVVLACVYINLAWLTNNLISEKHFLVSSRGVFLYFEFTFEVQLPFTC